ncbi:hypothetical protein [Methylomonas koyamae]|uniref:hypothetical protein n=1 Tax=Methylomonas koyamae TaxID=702114 RepID=UPI002872EE2C|nr:hypothetical protein [Methylomonas koyamae]WNB74563.1 hypothetical protein RI210_14875 [Methylomonas koyamae]
MRPESVVRYITLRTEAGLEGKDVAVRTVVKEDNNGKFHYDFSVFDQEAIFDSARQDKAATSAACPATISNDRGTDPSGLASCQLDENVDQLLDEVNGGMIVDSVSSGHMVLNLFIEGEEPEVIDEQEDVDVNQPNITTLQAIADGQHDREDLNALLDKIADAALKSRGQFNRLCFAPAVEFFIYATSANIPLASATAAATTPADFIATFSATI